MAATQRIDPRVINNLCLSTCLCFFVDSVFWFASKAYKNVERDA